LFGARGLDANARRDTRRRDRSNTSLLQECRSAAAHDKIAKIIFAYCHNVVGMAILRAQP
jgi:hypothetical protein